VPIKQQQNNSQPIILELVQQLKMQLVQQVQ
jgi:hypothetical protein